jgi:multiple sugar transport system substrate-binding protein
MAQMTALRSRRSVLKGIGAAVTAAAAAPVLAACGGGGSGSGAGANATIRFAFWGSDDRVKRFRQAIALFHQKNPTITVTPEFGAFEAQRTKIKVGMASGAGPDVLWLPDTIRSYTRDNQLLDITSAMNSQIKSGGYDNTAGKVDGKQYAVSYGLTSSCVFAKDSVLQAAGVTLPTYPEGQSWEEFKAACDKIHAAKGANFFGTDDPTYINAHNHLRLFARQRGENQYSADSADIGFSKETLTAWLQYWKDMRDSGAAEPPKVELAQPATFAGSGIIRNVAGIHLRFSNQYNDLQALTKDPISIHPFPGYSGGESGKALAFEDNMLAVAKTSKHPEAAIAFINFMVSDKDRAKIIGTSVGAPPSPEVSTFLRPLVSAPEQKLLDYVSYEVKQDREPVPSEPLGAVQFESDMDKACQELAYGRSSVADTVTQIFGPLRDKLKAAG